MIIRAFAKVNIALQILGRREDGYHILKSFMQALPDLYDVIEIVESDETEITCSDETLSCNDDNLAAKALKALNKKAKVHIEKHIPIAAGLAGGSADAAAVIYAFEGASPRGYEIAAALGSDVPFSLMAIQNSGRCAAIATGTGTELTPCNPISGKIITVTPNIAVSTPAVYKMYDEMVERGLLSARGTINEERLDSNSISGAQAFSGGEARLGAQPKLDARDFALACGNDLQAPAIRLCPQIQDTLDKLKQPHPTFGQAIKVQQSGSGPTCFAIYKEETK